jgi:hypothetical protein
MWILFFEIIPQLMPDIMLFRKLDWVDDEVGKKTEKFRKIVILKNMYTQQELDVCE